MSPHRRLRLPISTRHAFALAFDLAVRRDAAHSLVLPFLMRAPWILALALLPPVSESDRPGQVMLLSLVALLGDFFVLLTVTAMLRFRARSVFNTPVEVHPAPAAECYAQGLRRVPWLLVTEVVRNLSLVIATFFLLLPALLLGFRLAFATEAVVLSERDTSRAFQKSFHLTEGRFERWLEMTAISAFLVFAVLFLVAALGLIFPGPDFGTWYAVAMLLITAVMPIIQYAWTFFFLRLIETETPGVEVGPMYAGAAVAGATPAMPETPGALVPVGPAAPEIALAPPALAVTDVPQEDPHTESVG